MVEGYQNIEGEISKMQQSLESDKESPQKLKQYSQEIGSTAQKSKDELSALATKLVSDEAKNFLATAAEKKFSADGPRSRSPDAHRSRKNPARFCRSGGFQRGACGAQSF
jgi:CRISPR/Cas system-associated endonuclease Cas1